MTAETLLRPMYFQYFHSVSTILGVMSCVYIAAFYANNQTVVLKLSSLGNIGFFIFAFHLLITPEIKTLVCKLISPTANITWIICYLMAFSSLILISVLVYSSIKRTFPLIEKLLTGAYLPNHFKQENPVK